MALRATFISQRIAIPQIAVLCEALTRLDELYLADHPTTQPLYRAGVRYVPEDGSEEFADLPTVYQRREGDCEDLACIRAAELRRQGFPMAVALPLEVPRGNDGVRLIHIVVVANPFDPVRTFEDPSARLGMRALPEHLIAPLLETSKQWFLPRCSSWR